MFVRITYKVQLNLRMEERCWCLAANWKLEIIQGM